MPNLALVLGVPMAALLAAAVYFYRRAMTEAEAHSRPNYVREPWGTAPGSSCRSSSSPTVARRRSARLRGEASRPDRSNNSQGSVVPDSGFSEEKQCEICFDDQASMVELYPCKHSDICTSCVLKLLTSNKIECPFCRGHIQGFVDIDTGVRFG